MTTRPLEAMFKRILIPLDAGEEDAATLETAIRLALRFRAELVGIFVEDADLMRLAQLPFARETAYLSAVTRRLNPGDIARALRVRAAIVQARLEQQATQAQLAWSFQVLQGDLLPEQLAVSPGSDLLILQVDEKRTRRLRGPAAMARRIFMHTACTVWLHRAQTGEDRPVVVLFEDAPTNLRVLAVASQFARRDGKHLLVMVSAADGAEFRRLAKQAGAALADGGMEAEFRPLAPAAAADLIQLVSAAQGKLLVIDRASPLSSGERYQRLLDDLPCGVVLVG